jgi:low affinity Fe/Cu permease
MQEWFHKVSSRVSNIVGSPLSFVTAVVIVGVWALTGPLFGFSDTWQLVINTGTTIVTFLMVFLIQNTQNRDGKAVQLKLDELIRTNKGARNEFLNLENLADDALVALDADFQKIGADDSAHVLHPIHEKLVAEKVRRHHGASALAADVTDALKRVVKH